MDNYNNAPQCRYGLSPSQIDMFKTEDNPICQQSESVTKIVLAVTELLVAQFMWFDYDNQSKPIYRYINSSGTQAYFITNMEPIKFWEFGSLVLEGLGYESCMINVWRGYHWDTFLLREIVCGRVFS
ncbi:ATP-dependent Clp protease proteolytic subunit-related protein 1, chloroplastic-like isoform X2 [Camellia sinensis]|uniref:ATP-dependent Clp protease proteolytic subunit-related protein 1, chloroplastic-like isoform X2 n=1 Tax=Camellia sinensis TaxID=4442 RepID=UPI001035878D|nr:ATP-dependent Clp protease proteolytic subunit-related protein 1, chloroplastic-like isoform X2 [Camellia sinensis]